MNNQKYEKYWSLTLAYTNIHSDKFHNTLKAIIVFINQHSYLEPTTEHYNRLQLYVSSINGLDGTSLRKSINQFVKLGFINDLKSYNQESLVFLNAKTQRKRNTLFSKIVYKYSSFNRSMSNRSQQKEINFLLKTLEEVGSLTKENIIGLMNINILEYVKGYVNAYELNIHTLRAIETGFIQRKYNQIGYLLNLLKKLDDVIFIDNILYFEDDAKVIFGKDLHEISRKRDGYLHRLYKNQLKEESLELFGKTKCMLEKLAYPVLIASHIKPFILSNENEAYDPSNGLLLSRTIDSLFDLKYISFKNDGKIIFTDRVESDVISFWQNYTLDSRVLTEERLKYLKFHRQLVGV
jgi:predicted restriction endonuclease